MILPVFGIKPWHDWDKVENKPGKRLGTSYIAARLKPKGPVLVTIKVPSDPIITDEDIRRNYKGQTATWIEFADYDEDMYSRNNVTFYTATATAATLVDDAIDIS